MLKSLRKNFQKRQAFFVIVLTTVISVIATVITYQHGLILAYGDAESHLNIAKRVVSSITPGFGQLGGNWLPLHHMMMLPFVWNDFLWRTGLAGSFASMFSFILSSFFIFRLVNLITGKNLAGWIGVLLFVSNPGILYMQSTPMGELPMIAMMLGSVYFMVRWMKNENILNLVLAAFFVFCGSLMRYDLWFLFFFEVLAIGIIAFVKKFSFEKARGIAILFGTAGSLGILLWIGWNKIIFNDPTYFLTSPYSAKSQQLAWLSRGQLPSYHNIVSSFSFYTLATVENTGLIITILMALGIILLPFILKHGRKTSAFIVSLLLTSPYFFYVLTLFLGISIVLVPELLPNTFQYKLFNIRYGLMMIPAGAVIVALLFGATNKVFRSLLILLILIQIGIFVKDGGNSVVLQDGANGLSSRRPSPVNSYVAKNYDYGMIMFDDFSRAANPVDLGIPMQKIIYVGNHPYWDNALKNPSGDIRWFVIRHDENDVIWQHLRNNKTFQNNYVQAFHNGKTYVYKFKDSNAQIYYQKSNQPSFWKYECIDTMKSSRDEAKQALKNKKLNEEVKKQMDEIVKIGANCVAISTPYDDEFLPVLKAWVEGAREHNLAVWFRGNFSGWEGWFSYPENLTPEKHLSKTAQFIKENKELFKNGDIFTPAPEAENGKEFEKLDNNTKEKYRKFLVDEYETSKKAFRSIGKDVTVNWLSMSGGVAKSVLDKKTVNNIGQTVTIDHYTNNPQEMASLIKNLNKTYSANVVLGEFGAPIPSINGKMNDKEQAQFVNSLLEVLYKNRQKVEGINYWVLTNGTTSLLANSTQPKPVVQILKNYFKPATIQGQVKNSLGEPIPGITIRTNNTQDSTVTTDRNGKYALVLPAKEARIQTANKDYKSKSKVIRTTAGKNIKQDFVVEPKRMSLIYKIRLLLKDLGQSKQPA